jgi:ABC-type transport system substrate-binding protein
MKHLFRGGRRKVAAVMAVALVASLSQVAPTSAATKKNNLTILVGEKDAGWCSQDSPGLDQIAIKNSVAETLMIRNSKGVVVPYLAKGITGSADFKTWDIELRQGIYFHDGEELTAATLVANLAANLGLTVKGSLPAIAWQGMFGGVTSLAAFSQKVVATGKYTVRLNLPTPRPDVPSVFYSNGRPVILSSATLKSPSCGKTVVYGTGPFKVKSKGVDQFTTVLEANTNYWRKADDGSALPKAKEVTFKVVQDSAQRRNALVQGTADMAVFGWTNGTQINNLKSNKDIVLYKEAQDTSSTIHFNTMVAPFNNKNARLAVQFAIDRDSLVSVLSKGNALPATSFGASYHDYYVKKSGVSFDLAKAKEYVAAYTKDTGKALEVLLPQDDTVDGQKTVDLLAKQMEAAGIKTSKMAPVDPTSYILRGFALKQQFSWFNVIASRDSSFASLFSTKTDLELSGFRFSNPALATCFDSARASGVAANYKACAATLHAEAYWTPIATYGNFLAVRKNVTGVGATKLPNGGSREVLGRAGWDFASVVVGG